MTLTFSVRGVKQNTSITENIHLLKYPCESKTTCNPYESDLPRGKYRFSLYGAGGGSRVSGYEGLGGFSTGVLSLRTLTHLYFFIGAKGGCPDFSKGSDSAFGGGGKGFSGTWGYGCSGGGASDIRLTENNLKTRLIVAGGAGGSGYWPGTSNVYMIGGNGGGESGTKGEDYDKSGAGNPGSQTDGGSSIRSKGEFGFGGNITADNGCGGGGGWFGGGGGYSSVSAGGGGSGFVFLKSNSFIELDLKYRLVSGKTAYGNNSGDGYIVVEYLGISAMKRSVCQPPFIFSRLFLISNFISIVYS